MALSRCFPLSNCSPPALYASLQSLLIISCSFSYLLRCESNLSLQLENYKIYIKPIGIPRNITEFLNSSFKFIAGAANVQNKPNISSF